MKNKHKFHYDMIFYYYTWYVYLSYNIHLKKKKYILLSNYFRLYPKHRKISLCPNLFIYNNTTFPQCYNRE